MRVVATSVLGKEIKHRYVYEVELQERSINTRVEDFTLPEWKKEAMADFFQEHYKLINSTFPQNIRNYIFPKNGKKIETTWVKRRPITNLFWMQAKRDIEKIYFEAQNMLNFYQESYFLYDRSNIARQSFANKLNQFLPIYCSASFFGEKNKSNETDFTRKCAKFCY